MTIDRTKVTFEQAEGFEPLPGPMSLRVVSRRFRSMLYDRFVEELIGCASENDDVIDPWWEILHRHHVRVLMLPSDEFDAQLRVQLSLLKERFFDSEYQVVLGFVQRVLRDPNCPRGLQDFVGALLESEQEAYVLIEDGPTIIPRVTPEEKTNLETALVTAREAGLDGAYAHLRTATEELSKGQAAGCIREAIHSVESAAKFISGKDSAVLRDALKALKSKMTIHPALERAMEQMYAYTSDEKGVRHALVFDGEANADMTDAIFMLGSCAAFVSFLAGKARAAGLIKDWDNRRSIKPKEAT